MTFKKYLSILNVNIVFFLFLSLIIFRIMWVKIIGEKQYVFP